MGRQDLSGLQTRKMKGLKRSRDVTDDEDAFLGAEDEVMYDVAPGEKRSRMDRVMDSGKYVWFGRVVMRS